MPELIRDKPGIDEIEIQTSEEKMPHLIPADDDESVSEAGRKEDGVSDSASDTDPPVVIGPKISTTNKQATRAQLVPDPCNETAEQRSQQTRAEQKRDRRLKSVLRQLESSIDVSPKEIASMGRGKRNAVTFEDEAQGEHFGKSAPENIEQTSTSGGETTAVAIEPDDTVHTVHFVFNTAVASDSGEPKTANEAFQHPDPVERKRWRKSGITEYKNFLERNSWSKYPREKVAEQGRKVIGTKLVFKKKIEAAGSKAADTYGDVRYKTRGVTLGYQ